MAEKALESLPQNSVPPHRFNPGTGLPIRQALQTLYPRVRPPALVRQRWFYYLLAYANEILISSALRPGG